jgi:hypothetical protein
MGAYVDALYSHLHGLWQCFFLAKFRPTNQNEYFVAKFVLNKFGMITNGGATSKK